MLRLALVRRRAERSRRLQTLYQLALAAWHTDERTIEQDLRDVQAYARSAGLPRSAAAAAAAVAAAAGDWLQAHQNADPLAVWAAEARYELALQTLLKKLRGGSVLPFAVPMPSGAIWKTDQL